MYFTRQEEPNVFFAKERYVSALERHRETARASFASLQRSAGSI